MNEKLITSDKLILGCGSFFLIGFVFLCVGDSAGDTATKIGGYCCLFGIISPLIVMAFRGKINEAFHKRNPQPKIDIKKKDEEDIPNDSGEHPLTSLVKIFKDLGFWSIIPLTLSAVAISYAFKHLNRLDNFSFSAYWWAFILPCFFFFGIFHYLFDKYINK